MLSIYMELRETEITTKCTKSLTPRTGMLETGQFYTAFTSYLLCCNCTHDELWYLRHVFYLPNGLFSER